MRKLISSIFMLTCCCAGVWAQLLTVTSTERVTLPDGAIVADATLSPDGSFVVLSDYLKPGLDRLDLATGDVARISDTGVSLDLKISSDGNQVMFRENTYSADHLRYVTLRSANLKTGATQVIVDKTRNLQGSDLRDGMAVAVDNGRLRTRSLNGNSVGTSVDTPVVSIDRGQLCVTTGGVTKVLSPMGIDGQSYLWPEISPDGTKIVFYLAATGCFVCNIDGSDCRHLGVLRAARWMGNDIVVGMCDIDDGMQVTSSALIASNADGTVKQTLTQPDVIAMYPSTAVEAGKISFTTPQGELYIIKVQ